MKVKFTATIYADIPINVEMPEIINSDTIGDYKAELDAAIHNSAGNWIGDYLDKVPYEDMCIEYAEPYEDGIDEYGQHLAEWVNEYPKQIAKWEEKIKNGLIDESKEF